MNSELRITKIKSFTDLNAWKEGHKLVLEIYSISSIFPKEEIFGLSSQMKRAAVSITSNIAEGFSRKSYKEKVQFYTISQGSVTELQNQLIIAKDVGFIDENVFDRIQISTTNVQKILNGLIKATRNYGVKNS